MNDTWELWDTCEHGSVGAHKFGHGKWCPGGRKVVLREEFIPMNASFPINRLVYVEAEDE